MEKSKTKIRQILCWCKKRKTLLAFLAVMLFLSVSAAVIAYTKTAWPEAEDNHVIVRMTDPNGAEIARMAIKAKTTWKTSYGNKTKENFNAQKLTINLSKISSSGNIKLLNPSAVKAKKSDGIEFSVQYYVPAHIYRSGGTSTKRGNGHFHITNDSAFGHSPTDRWFTVKYQVHLSNFGMVWNSKNERQKGVMHTIITKRNSYTVKFGDMKTVSVACGGSTTAPTPNFWAYHKFNGWKCGNETVAAGGTTSVCGANKTFTAQWEDYYYNINYDSNGGGQATKTQKIDRNESKAELMDDIFARPHYELTGWNTKPDGTGTPYPLGGTVNHLTTTNKGTVTLYAQWRLLTHTVKFDGNGATSGQMADQFIDEGDPQELRTNAFKRKGYYFCGWSTKRDGAAEYRDEETFTAVPNTGGQTTTLYAVWSRDGSFQVDNVTDDTSMFEGCDNLVGGNGTTYDYSHIDSKEANIDIPSDRGYFTAK